MQTNHCGKLSRKTTKSLSKASDPGIEKSSRGYTCRNLHENGNEPACDSFELWRRRGEAVKTWGMRGKRAVEPHEIWNIRWNNMHFRQLHKRASRFDNRTGQFTDLLNGDSESLVAVRLLGKFRNIEVFPLMYKDHMYFNCDGFDEAL